MENFCLANRSLTGHARDHGGVNSSVDCGNYCSRQQPSTGRCTAISSCNGNSKTLSTKMKALRTSPTPASSADISCRRICIMFHRQSKLTLASPAVGRWGTCPLDLQQFSFPVNFRTAQSLTATLSGCLFVFCVSSCSSSVAASYEPRSVYYFASFYMRQKFLCSFVPPPRLVADPGDTTDKVKSIRACRAPPPLQ